MEQILESSSKKHKSSKKKKLSVDLGPDPSRISLLMSKEKHNQILSNQFHYDQELFAPISFSDMQVLQMKQTFDKGIHAMDKYFKKCKENVNLIKLDFQKQLEQYLEVHLKLDLNLSYMMNNINDMGQYSQIVSRVNSIKQDV